jgi:hypothetical protein
MALLPLRTSITYDKDGPAVHWARDQLHQRLPSRETRTLISGVGSGSPVIA